MRKVFIVMLFLLIPATGFADNTSWIKGGLTWGDFSGCNVDGTGPADCLDLDTEDEFFFQLHKGGKHFLRIVPGKLINLAKSKKSALRPSGFCLQLRKRCRSIFVSEPGII